MRKFKFRAYNQEIKKMIFLDPRQWPLVVLEGEENWEVMMWTGLLDSHGEEIYEGDILCHEDFVNSKRKNKCLGVMEWDEKVAGFVQFHPLCKFEVIGNIHENKELLIGGQHERSRR